MKNQQPIKSVTLSLAIDDLKLIDEAVCKLHTNSKCDYKKCELDRIIWLLGRVINSEIYEYSDSQIMNS